MERLLIENYEELSEIMHDEAVDGKTTYAVLFYDEAIDLIRNLLDFKDIDMNSMEIAPGEFNGYFKEYVITLTSEMQLDVEPVWHEANKFHSAGYLWLGSADVIYLDGDANSSILKNIDGNAYELVVCDDEDDDEDVDDEAELLEEDFDFVEYLTNFIRNAGVVHVVVTPPSDCE